MPHQPRRAQDLLKPSMRVASVLEIDLAHLRDEGVRGFIFDLDDTLVCALDDHAAPEICDWITEIQAEFRTYIVSNNASHQRVDVAAGRLAMPCVSRAAKPSRRFFRQALAEMGLSAHEVAIVGDQLFTDVLGGNRLGAMTILVDPLSEERKWHRKVMRRLESRMLKGHLYHRPHHPSISPTGQPHHGESSPTHRHPTP